MCREEWSGPVPTYMPKFYNGWKPSPHHIEDIVMPPVAAGYIDAPPRVRPKKSCVSLGSL